MSSYTYERKHKNYAFELSSASFAKHVLRKEDIPQRESILRRCMLGKQNKQKIEPGHDKTNKLDVHPAKTHISLGIRPV